MTKAELVETMAKDAGISKVAAATALNAFMDGVTSALKKKRRQGHAGRVWHFFKSPSQGSQRTQSSNRRSNQNQSLQRCKITALARN